MRRSSSPLYQDLCYGDSDLSDLVKALRRRLEYFRVVPQDIQIEDGSVVVTMRCGSKGVVDPEVLNKIASRLWQNSKEAK